MLPADRLFKTASALSCDRCVRNRLQIIGNRLLLHRAEALLYFLHFRAGLLCKQIVIGIQRKPFVSLLLQRFQLFSDDISLPCPNAVIGFRIICLIQRKPGVKPYLRAGDQRLPFLRGSCERLYGVIKMKIELRADVIDITRLRTPGLDIGTHVLAVFQISLRRDPE